MVLKGLSSRITGQTIYSALPGHSVATREELSGACRRHGSSHHLAGEQRSNPCNSEWRQHVSCPSKVVFVRNATIDRPFLIPSQGLVNGPEDDNLRA
jgi:hypothetical protein